MNKKFTTIYLTNKKKFFLSILFTIIYTSVAVFLNIRWMNDLLSVFPMWLSISIIGGIAVLPSILMCMMIIPILLDKPRHFSIIKELPALTILIAAYNEESCIYETLEFISRQIYNGSLTVFVIDNNSKDNTKLEVHRAIEDFPQLNIEYYFEPKQGKFNALNTGLDNVRTLFTVTLDADTILFKDALNYLATSMVQESRNKNLAATVGAIFVRNSRVNLLTKLQEWDYFLSISGIKRSQGMFESTLVAQGAFSLYKTEALREMGGWSDTIGEDIVLSWDFLAAGYKIHYIPKAIAFTQVPETLKAFQKQRSRWARGMVEGLRQRPFWKYPSIYSKAFIGLDFLLFGIDFSIVIFWIPGIILALFGKFWIVGPMTLLVLPLTLIVFGILYLKEYNGVFKEMGLKVRKHFWSFIVFLFTYQLIMSPISLIGYFQEIFRVRRKWK